MRFIQKLQFNSPSRLIIWVWCLIILCSCVAPHRSKQQKVASPKEVDPTTLTPQETSQKPYTEQYQLALEFDQWMKGRSPNKQSELKERCETNPDASPFCFSVNNFDRLEKQKKIFQASSKKRARVKRVMAHLNKDQITNWIELRFSPVMATLSPLKRLKKESLEVLKKAALRETGCPNNIAISLAAFLEDELPDKISYQMIADLYLKGARCPPDGPGDSETLMTRAGLMFFAAQDLKSAESCFKKSSEDPNAFRARALYWLHKIYKETRKTFLAKQVLEELKLNYPFSFHTLMALNSVNEDPGLILKKPGPELLTRSTQAPHLNNLIEQVEVLNNHGFTQASDKVLDWILADAENAEPEFMIYVSDLNHSQGNYLDKLKILTNVLYGNPRLSSKPLLERYFPKLYFPVFEKHSGGLDPYLLMSIARRESAFNPKAVSVARAKGLMQISPGTHRRLSSKKKSIFDPEHNISIGSRYLSDLIRKADGSIHLALASYNAGPKRVDIWTARYPTSDPVLFIDLIPYRETREYVASVLRNYYWYRRLHAEDGASSTPTILNP